jgi:3-isopropylmalate dehydratase small subunit
LYLALFFLGIKNYIKIFYNNIIKEPILKILQINETPEKIILEISKNLKNILENSKKKEEIITRNFFVIVLIFIAI